MEPRVTRNQPAAGIGCQWSESDCLAEPRDGTADIDVEAADYY